MACIATLLGSAWSNCPCDPNTIAGVLAKKVKISKIEVIFVAILIQITSLYTEYKTIYYTKHGGLNEWTQEH